MKFYNPVKLINYQGSRKELLDSCEGSTILVFCSKTGLLRFRKDPILNSFFSLPNVEFEHGFENNPSLVDLQVIARNYSEKAIDLIVGLGGGSCMDAAKISSISINAHKVGISIQSLLNTPSLLQDIPSIKTFQVPTTAGTGSEVTPFATVWDYEAKQKKSLHCSSMYAAKAFIDCDFITDLPVEIALTTGLDALNQAFESIWNKNANCVTRSLAERAIVLSLENLYFIDQLQSSSEHASNIATASMLAGLSISQTRTGICHSISYPMTLEFGMPHGYACAYTMLPIYNYNFEAIKDTINTITSKLDGKCPRFMIEEIYKKFGVYNIFSRYIPSYESIISLRSKMTTLGRFDNNIVKVSEENLSNIIKESYNLATE